MPSATTAPRTAGVEIRSVNPFNAPLAIAIDRASLRKEERQQIDDDDTGQRHAQHGVAIGSVRGHRATRQCATTQSRDLGGAPHRAPGAGDQLGIQLARTAWLSCSAPVVIVIRDAANSACSRRRGVGCEGGDRHPVHRSLLIADREMAFPQAGMREYIEKVSSGYTNETICSPWRYRAHRPRQRDIREYAEDAETALGLPNDQNVPPYLAG
jgi:hypothetical protein